MDTTCTCEVERKRLSGEVGLERRKSAVETERRIDLVLRKLVETAVGRPTPILTGNRSAVAGCARFLMERQTLLSVGELPGRRAVCAGRSTNQPDFAAV